MSLQCPEIPSPHPRPCPRNGREIEYDRVNPRSALMPRGGFRLLSQHVAKYAISRDLTGFSGPIRPIHSHRYTRGDTKE
jgi:hypothetical protein